MGNFLSIWNNTTATRQMAFLSSEIHAPEDIIIKPKISTEIGFFTFGSHVPSCFSWYAQRHICSEKGMPAVVTATTGEEGEPAIMSLKL